MKILALIARLLLGLMFVFFGLNGFLHFLPATMPAGLAGQFLSVLFASHYAYLVFAVQLIGGLLLWANRFVPLALVLLAAVIANILVYHITMQPAGIGPGLLAAILWLIVAYEFRAALKPLFVSKVVPDSSR
jgi:putative oxidoreductase